MNTSFSPVTIRGKTIQFDENGLACLNDIWSASGFSKNHRPNDWLRLPSTTKLVEAVISKVTGKSRNWTKTDIKSVWYAKVGVGTFADVRLALAYSEYLNPKLALEVKEVFLRFKAADPTLADEVLQRATPEANEWAAKRAMGRVIRNEYTLELDKRGVKKPPQFASCTNETYVGLFDATAKALKAQRGLSSKANLRDKLSTKELAFVAAAEALAVEHMEEVGAAGYGQCKTATGSASRAIRSAIETDRKARQPRIPERK